MAKLPGNPNSATSEFFVNVANANAGNLDFQNGGFTVFGRVAGTGMGVVNQINGLPRGNYDIPLGSGQQRLEDVPINDNTAPSTMDASKLVKVSSITRLPNLQFEVTSSNSSVASVTMVGTNVRVAGVSSGIATIRVKATDLDGNSRTRSFKVTVP
jgi:cyclophilin family peptidyl-prolyl cis-trans isomerase